MKSGRYILWVDDDLDDLFIFRQALQQIDPAIQVKEASNGIEAVEHLQEAWAGQDLPCLIVMDLNMPLKNGRETIPVVRQHPFFSSIPMVVFTTSSSVHDQQFCKEHGIDFFIKPLHFNELVQSVSKIVSYCDPAA